MAKAGQFSGNPKETLTRRETDILVRLVENRTNQEIARLESLAPSSVKWYVNQILTKLGSSSRIEAVARARELGLVPSPAQFPPPISPPRSNLPRQLTSFIGREAEIARLSSLVRSHPLVTLTGTGGVGKTRLAIETATRLLPHFPQGIWLAELAPLSNPALLPQAMVNALALIDRSSQPPLQLLTGYLRSRHSLLLLDNCEHLLAAVQDLVHHLLLACPRLTILATSRVLLGVEGEVLYRCPSLSLPSGEPSQSEALRLFAARAASVSPTFVLDPATTPLAAQICRHLDGIPLAIELASARLRHLSLAQVAARLDDLFALLQGGAKTSLPHHQTLSALIDWSYLLLSDSERLLFQRLSIFPASFSLESAEAICSGDGLPPSAILELLSELVDKSLLEAFPAPFGMRYRILETIRQYAWRKMQPEQLAELRRRHLDFFHSFALRAEPNLINPHLCEWRQRIDAELDNLRAALEYSLSGPLETGLFIFAALHWYWHGRGNLHNESDAWLKHLLAAEAAGPDELRQLPSRRVARARVILLAGHWGIPDSPRLAREAAATFAALGQPYRLDWAIALLWSRDRDIQELLAIFRQMGDPFWISNVLWQAQLEAVEKGNFSQARDHLEESLRITRALGYTEGQGSILLHLGQLEFWLGNPARALTILQSAHECFLASGSIGKATVHLAYLAEISLSQGDYPQAEEQYRLHLAESQDFGISLNNTATLAKLARVALCAGRRDQAEQYLDEALRLSHALAGPPIPALHYVLARIAILDGRYAQAYPHLLNVHPKFLSLPALVQVYGVLAAAEGRMSAAARLFGSLEAYPWWGHPLPPPEREAYQPALSAARAALSPEEFSAAWQLGRSLTAHQALTFARAP